MSINRIIDRNDEVGIIPELDIIVKFLGHSMGTTGFMVMANKHPELQDKIILANFLAPVAYMSNIKSPIKLIAPYADSLEVGMLNIFSTMGHSRPLFLGNYRLLDSNC